VEHVTRRDPLLVAATKIFSLSVLIGVFNLYRYESYDGRLMMMALTLCGLSHLLIVYRLQEFEHNSVAWWRNLPIRIETRYFRIAAALGVFLMPECIALFNYFPLQQYSFWTMSGVLYLISINCLLVGLIQSATMQLASLTKKAFAIMTALLLFILFGMPGIILAAACLVAGFVLFMCCYYTFEPPVGSNQ
jgi:hypothetical protein